jgi:hypothetical protein
MPKSAEAIKPTCQKISSKPSGARPQDITNLLKAYNIEPSKINQSHEKILPFMASANQYEKENMPQSKC